MLFTVPVINNGKVHNSSVLVYRPETGINDTYMYALASVGI
jgi:hypothetical protein